MAIDKLINSTQGDSIIAALGSSGSIAQSLAMIAAKSNTPYNSDNKLNPSFIAYDTTHAAVTEAQRTQIGTNTTNIVWNTNNGVKNILTGAETSTTRNNVTFTVNSDKSITVKTGSSGASGSDATFFKVATSIKMTAGTWTLSGGYSASCRIQDANGNWQCSTSAVDKTFAEDTTYSFFIRVQPGWINTDGVTLYPMVCPKSIYDTDPTYQPYALSNSELTVENGINKNNILSLYKVGSANILKNTAQTQTVGGVTFTMNADGTITANGTKTDNEWLYLSTGNSLKKVHMYFQAVVLLVTISW